MIISSAFIRNNRFKEDTTVTNTIFTGMATALVTPLTPTGVDYAAMGRLIDFQIDSGIDALVAVGTTGESATLEPSEQAEVIRFTVQRAAGRVPVIAGAGTNNTAHVLENTKTPVPPAQMPYWSSHHTTTRQPNRV